MSKKRITGSGKLNVNGKSYKIEDGSTLNPGGVTRTAVTSGGEVHGYKEETAVTSLEVTIIHTADVSLRELSDLTDATVFFETDSGVQYVIRDAWATEPAVLNSKEGTVSLKLEGISCEEM